MRVIAIFALAVLAACGSERSVSDPPEMSEGAVMPDTRSASPDDLRALHAEVLTPRGPSLESLPGVARRVAQTCLAEPDGLACRRGRDDLPADLRRSVDAAVAEYERVAAAAAERLELCRRGDQAALEARYPGHLAFYRAVAAPPPAIDEALDAVVAIAISGNVVSKATRVLEQGLAREALDVQVRSPGSQSGYSPNPFAQQRNTVPNLFRGHYTPTIERRMAEARPECDALSSAPAIQGACRRDLTVDIVGDWLRSRGHASARVILGAQSAWPEYAVLFERRLADVDIRIDPNFDRTLGRTSTFASEMCDARSTIWSDYEFYARTLLR
ncbi:hypothetical protein V3331_18000 [Gaopeijia maritima]|uniref:hypothetical protein n=1 Tax=Gaopeijia maritima TaxID=3119007 RepID=UPI0032474CD3